MNTAMMWLAKIAFSRKLLEAVASANSSLTGYRSQLIVIALAIVAILGYTGLLDKEVAGTIIAALLGALPPTMAEKAKNILGKADKILPPPPTPKP